jgi:transcriptional regulator with XRE-family HTH domain
MTGNILTITLKTPHETLLQVAANFKELRLEQNLTQEGLANRSGVSWGSVKRFEGSGQISLQSLLKVSLVLGVLNQFEELGKQSASYKNSLTLDEILKQKKIPKKGSLK